MKHTTIVREAEKLGKEVTNNNNEYAVTYRVKLNASDSLVWMVFGDSDDASGVGVCGSYEHNVSNLKTLRQVLNQ